MITSSRVSDRNKVKIENRVLCLFGSNPHEAKQNTVEPQVFKREKWLNFVDVRAELMQSYSQRRHKAGLHCTHYGNKFKQVLRTSASI